MVQGQHRVRLPTTEIRLQFDNRLTAFSAETIIPLISRLRRPSVTNVRAKIGWVSIFWLALAR